MGAAFELRIDLTGLDAQCDADYQDLQASARPAAQEMAQVFYDQVKRNVAAIRRYSGNLDRAIYQAFSQSNSSNGIATYHVGWNPRKAPHGHWLEYGFLQRYLIYRNALGHLRPMVRPGLDGTARPGRRATQAEKDAYYVPMPGGPRHVPGKSFVRRAYADRLNAARAAGERRLLEEFNKRRAARR